MRGSSRYTRTRPSMRDRLDTRIPASRSRCSWRLIAGRLRPNSAPKLDGRLGATASAATIRRLVGSAKRSMPAPLRFGISRACVRPLYCHSIGSRTRRGSLTGRELPDRGQRLRIRAGARSPRWFCLIGSIGIPTARATYSITEIWHQRRVRSPAETPRPRTRRARRSSRWRASRWRARHLVRWARRARPLGLRRHRRVGRR
jgi:hypothetical protein